MNRNQWQRVETLYHQALECELDARPAFLLETCSDELVRLEVAELLKYDGQAKNFIETPAFKRAAKEIAAEVQLEPDSMPPREIGPYRLLAPLSPGGMGEVHLALDTRLNRKVAIKLLPSAFADDAERARRFKHEARASSALSHPNIVTIFEVGEVEGRHYIVTEYVEGETLRQLINSESGKGFEPQAALDIASQVVKALQAAHNAGVIHRDIKPENVIVRKDGLVKVLDFGLAKFSSDDLLETESQSQQLLTRSGVVMGTAAYMSPEQARGQQIDRRTDIFSFGALTYEMLAGERPFTGATTSDVIAAVLIKEPEPLAKVAPHVQATVAAIVHRCLEKQAEKRFQSADDLASTLLAATAAKPRGLSWKLRFLAVAEAVTTLWQRVRPRRKASITAALAMMLLFGIVILAVVKPRRFFGERPPFALSFKLPEGWSFRRSDVPAVSPDGRMIVVGALPANDRVGRESGLWLRRVDSAEATLLAGTEGGLAPFWSPDSRYVAFWQQEKLKRVNVTSGAVSTLLDDGGTISGEAESEIKKQPLGPTAPSVGTWGLGDVILLSLGSRLARLTVGGSPVAIERFADGETGQYNPRFLPDGRHFLYYSRNQDRQEDGIYLASLDFGAPRKLLLKNATAASYVSPGFLLFSREGQVAAQHFDLTRFEVTGDPVGLTARLGKDQGGGSSAPLAAFSASDNGVLVWRPADGAAVPAQTTTQLTWFDRSGKRLGAIGQRASYSGPAFSPDEQHLVVAESDPKTRNRDLWVLDLWNGVGSRITSDQVDEFNPVWSPDGKWIYFTSGKDGRRNIYRKLADGTGSAELFLGTNEDENVEDISPDGRFLLFNSHAVKDGEPDLTVVSLDGSLKRTPFTATKFREDQAQFSPNGRWIAYRSQESGPSRILVQGFTANGSPASAKWEVSNKDGVQPRWSADGKELFYLEGDELMVVDIDTTGDAITHGIARPLFKVSVESNQRRNRYLVSRDGQRILVVALAEALVGSTVAAQINWPATIER